MNIGDLRLDGNRNGNKTIISKPASIMMHFFALLALVAMVAGFATPGHEKGCYNMQEHKCYCEMTEAECKPSPKYLWTASCHKPCTTDGDGVGCYNQAGDHLCDCSLAEDQCTEGMWTAACSWCAGPIPEGPEGCYDMSEHKCQCDTSKADCKLPNVWTTGCASCKDGSSMGLGAGYAIIF
jgi:hypothetical protein